MTDLLEMATELVATIRDMWADERLSGIGRDNVCTVITGYQELIREMIEVMEYVQISNGYDEQRMRNMILKARGAIP